MPRADERPDLVVFYGRGGGSELERLVDGARRASTRQLVAEAVVHDLFRHVVLVTNDRDLAGRLEAEHPALDIDRTPDTIDFGQQLRTVAERLRSRAVVYVGGGGAPFLDAGELRAIVGRIAPEVTGEAGVVFANNYLSSDYVAFRPAAALARTLPIRNDNDLAWRLHHDAGLARAAVESSPLDRLDIDTPTDLALLRLVPEVRGELRVYLEAHAPALPALASVEATMADPYRTLIVAGRLNTQVLLTIEREVSFLKRLFVEERSMKANGRQERGEVRSLLAVLLREVGPDRFFAHLADLGDAVVFDTRPLFAHIAPHLSAADRFASDLLRPEAIANPEVREFTRAARDAIVPVVLGGHSLVTGGLWVLARRVKAAKALAVSGA